MESSAPATSGSRGESQLSEFERDILVKLLEGEDPILEGLRRQIGHCAVIGREAMDAGFSTSLLVGPVDGTVDAVGGSISGVGADIEGLHFGVGFVLFIDDGRLTMLEGSTLGPERWPPVVSQYDLRPLKDRHVQLRNASADG